LPAPWRLIAVSFGSELRHAGLAAALARKTAFTPEECLFLFLFFSVHRGE
jgi:hypothetical protein